MQLEFLFFQLLLESHENGTGAGIEQKGSIKGKSSFALFLQLDETKLSPEELSKISLLKQAGWVPVKGGLKRVYVHKNQDISVNGKTLHTDENGEFVVNELPVGEQTIVLFAQAVKLRFIRN